jgi:hypothetical protein
MSVVGIHVVHKARRFTVDYLCVLFAEDGVGLDVLFGNWKGILEKTRDVNNTKAFRNDETSR